MWIKICFKQYQIYQMKNMHKIVEAMLSNRLVFENYLYIEMYFNWFSYAYDIKYHIYIKRFYISHHILTLHINWMKNSISVCLPNNFQFWTCQSLLSLTSQLFWCTHANALTLRMATCDLPVYKYIHLHCPILILRMKYHQ